MLIEEMPPKIYKWQKLNENNKVTALNSETAGLIFLTDLYKYFIRFDVEWPNMER